MTDLTTRSRATERPGTIRFPSGLLGFPEVTEYQLSEGPGVGLFWLDGEGPDSPSFLLSDPFVYFDGLNLDFSPVQTEQIEAHESSQVAVLAITVPNGETKQWTANLQGPILINLERALAAQVVMTDPSLGVRRSFRPRLTVPPAGTDSDPVEGLPNS
jgi:flagellar assembly factor FliW